MASQIQLRQGRSLHSSTGLLQIHIHRSSHRYTVRPIERLRQFARVAQKPFFQRTPRPRFGTTFLGRQKVGTLKDRHKECTQGAVYMPLAKPELPDMPFGRCYYTLNLASIGTLAIAEIFLGKCLRKAENCPGEGFGGNKEKQTPWLKKHRSSLNFSGYLRHVAID